MPTDAQRRQQASAHHSEVQALNERINDLAGMAERLKLEAQIHAQEARTANATIAEIYQVCSGGTGEPGNWHGASPVRERIVGLEQQLAEARKDAERYRWLFKGNKVYSQFFSAYQPWDGSDGKAGFDASIDAAITSTQEQA